MDARSVKLIMLRHCAHFTPPQRARERARGGMTGRWRVCTDHPQPEHMVEGAVTMAGRRVASAGLWDRYRAGRPSASGWARR